MIIVSKFYSVTGMTEHWMIVPDWSRAYKRWNEIQGRLAVEKGIEPLWVATESSWDLVYRSVGQTVGVIARPGVSVSLELSYPWRNHV